MRILLVMFLVSLLFISGCGEKAAQAAGEYDEAYLTMRRALADAVRLHWNAQRGYEQDKYLRYGEYSTAVAITAVKLVEMRCE